eukprot:m.21092 g.21092  ORF g.21092 m.21092 type:complete len:296 (+) comp28137_c0_seq1:94-981(+)
MSQTNQTKAWQLSLYELHRQPQPPVLDDVEITVTPRSLRSEMMCPICLDILKTTMTTKECLHRFCQECIITALRSGNKECPTCRKKLVSKRSLRPDPTFDALIEKLCPGRDIQRVEQLQSAGPARSPKVGSPALPSVEVPQVSSKKDDNGVANGGKESEIHEGEIPLPSPSPPAVAATAVGSIQAEEEIDFMLCPHPDCTSDNPIRCVRTSVNATVRHLSKYLAIRASLEGRLAGSVVDGEVSLSDVSSEMQFRFYINGEGKPFQSLEGHLTLAEIQSRCLKPDSALELYYSPAF